MTVAPALSATYRAICKHLHGTEGGPFHEPGELELPKEDHSYPHTHVPQEFLNAAMQALKPKFLVEVGSMTGGSALRIGDAAIAAAAAEETPCLLCIDTWLGDTRMWLDHNPGWRDMLRLRRGFPGLYWQFLANVQRLSHTILPLPMTSMCALRALRLLAIEKDLGRPEFIYLDSAHEYGETLLEIREAFALLAPGGILLGDDLDWPAVEGDLRRFLAESPHLAARDEVPELPGLVFWEEAGFWVVNCPGRQWLLRKGFQDDAASLREAMIEQELGKEPAEYSPLTDADRSALANYSAGMALIESGQVGPGNTLIRQAVAASPSLAQFYGL